MENNRGQWGSNFGFLMAAVGSAVGLGNIWGSIIAATVLYVLPEALREFADYRMLVYAIVLILVMLVSHNPAMKNFATRMFLREVPAKEKNKKGGAL